jgi:hypothetical protein
MVRVGLILIDYGREMLIILQAEGCHKKGGILRPSASRRGIQLRRHNLKSGLTSINCGSSAV